MGPVAPEELLALLLVLRQLEPLDRGFTGCHGIVLEEQNVFEQ